MQRAFGAGAEGDHRQLDGHDRDAEDQERVANRSIRPRHEDAHTDDQKARNEEPSLSDDPANVDSHVNRLALCTGGRALAVRGGMTSLVPL